MVVAHRLSTIEEADRIIVLHHGELRESGVHKELMRKQSIYYKLYQLQYRRQAVQTAETENEDLAVRTSRQVK